MRIRLMSILLLLLLASVTAFAQSGEPGQKVMAAFTGNEFLNLCDATSIQTNLPSCRLFLNGFIQGMFAAKWDHAGTEARAAKCSSNIDNVTNQQLLDVVLKFLRDNPSLRDAPIGALAYEAINGAWPNACSQH